ncbi:MAG TPA: 16S rRNA (guanine(527)-N(7))-methyltransferase RsmG [Magnetospirillaceae bacterium]|jgi:16S rRNA (guanine527-N7)-methyltransferase
MAQFRQRDFAAAVHVSRETMGMFETYVKLLEQWQPKVNLIGASTFPDLWNRHMLDSAQVFPFLPEGQVLDAGSGAGFPGLVLGIMATEDENRGPIHLVESDGRKCAFLEEVIKETGAKAIIHNERIEAMTPFPVAAVTARALAPLDRLLPLLENFLVQPDAHGFFFKGKGANDELTEARKDWSMNVERIQSVTDPTGVLLHLTEVKRGRS